MMGENKKRKIWRDGNAEIALLECDNHSFPKHFHDEYVLGVNIIGGESVWLDGKQEEADLDDITVYNPGEIQSSSPLADNWSFVSIYFDDEYYMSKFGKDVSARFSKPVLRSKVFAQSMRSGCLACLRENLSNEEIHEFILLICDGLFTHAAKPEIPEIKMDPAVHKAMEIMLSDVSVTPGIDALAEDLSMTPVQFIRLFKKSTGLPPLTWLKNRKLQMVRKDLANNEKANYLAYKYGFSDQPHLTRQFKSVFGFTPKKYQQTL